MCECVPCVLERESSTNLVRGDEPRTADAISFASVPTGRPITQWASDTVRPVTPLVAARCVHIPGCGGCDVHVPRYPITDDEPLLRQSQA